MTWPLEAEGVREFAQGLEEILVVEEKRQILEYQLKEELYNWRDDVRPRVVGKFDDTGEWSNKHQAGHGEWLLPATYELNPAQIARAIASRIARYFAGHPIEARVRERIAYLEAKEAVLKVSAPDPAKDRIPHFCSGCPHNTSTRVPEGSRALAGIGCHYMALWMDRETATFTHMGGGRRDLDRRGAVHQREARVRQPGRRHLLPLGPAGDPRGGGRQGQHHLQDPVQRRGGDDRRPAGGRPDRPGDDLAPDRGRRRATDHRGDRRAGQVPGRRRLGAGRDDTPPRANSTRCSANCARCRASR